MVYRDKKNPMAISIKKKTKHLLSLSGAHTHSIATLLPQNAITLGQYYDQTDVYERSRFHLRALPRHTHTQKKYCEYNQLVSVELCAFVFPSLFVG